MFVCPCCLQLGSAANPTSPRRKRGPPLHLTVTARGRRRDKVLGSSLSAHLQRNRYGCLSALPASSKLSKPSRTCFLFQF